MTKAGVLEVLTKAGVLEPGPDGPGREHRPILDGRWRASRLRRGSRMPAVAIGKSSWQFQEAM
jgi:hypothetical protein